jgi:hypothetical protein
MSSSLIKNTSEMTSKSLYMSVKIIFDSYSQVKFILSKLLVEIAPIRASGSPPCASL